MLKKKEAVFIDFRNENQLKWFLNEGTKLCKWVQTGDDIIETSTNKVIGTILIPKGWNARKAIKIANSFFDEVVTITHEELMSYKK